MEIKSTADALSHLYKLSLNESNFRFRGQANHMWELKPSVYRFNDFQRYQTVQYEKNIVNVKPKIAQPPLTHTTLDLEWLMLCQHYGVPTRLIDWSSDILTALFFACYGEEEKDTDGCLYICKQDDYPLFYQYNESLMDSQELAFVSTHVINPRMRNQAGCFMMWGHSPENDSITETYDLLRYQENSEGQFFMEKIMIPCASKPLILQELDKIYSISYDSIYLKNGFLEAKYSKGFEELKETARLMTLYTTDADKLSEAEEKKARTFFRIECRNMIGNCVNLRKM